MVTSEKAARQIVAEFYEDDPTLAKKIRDGDRISSQDIVRSIEAVEYVLTMNEHHKTILMDGKRFKVGDSVKCRHADTIGEVVNVSHYGVHAKFEGMVLNTDDELKHGGVYWNYRYLESRYE